MFDKITVALSTGRTFTAYVAGDRVEIVATIDGHASRLGAARWDDAKGLVDCEVPLRSDAGDALVAAIRARERGVG